MEYTNYHTVLKRLEAATSRLEDLVIFNESKQNESYQDNRNGAISPKTAHITPNVPPIPHSNNTSPRGSVPARAPGASIDGISIAGTPAETAAATPSGAASSSAPSKNAGLEALEAIVGKELEEYVKISAEIAEPVGKQAQQFKKAFNEMLKIVALAQHSKKPSSIDELVAVLNPMSAEVSKIDELRNEFHRERDLANFLATVPAGAGALGWVSVEGKNEAKSFVHEMRDSSLFYGNRALKDHEDGKKWLNSYVAVLDAVEEAVKKHYGAGLEWNPNGGDASAAAASAPKEAAAAPSSSPAAASGGAPPPPPPPPSVAQLTANLDEKPAAAASAPAGGLTGVFAELSQGESIASSLKPVDKASLKSTKPPIPKSSKPGSKADATAAGSKPNTPAKKKNPRVELNESTWSIEDLDDKHDVNIEANMGQSVRIDNCSNCTITISGKAATFNMSRCSRVGLLVETMVASCDIVNSTNFGLQVTGSVPSLMIDQSGPGSIYLSESSLGINIFTSQTTAINLNIPEGEPGAYREVPLGEQIVHTISGQSIKSEVVKHA